MRSNCLRQSRCPYANKVEGGDNKSVRLALGVTKVSRERDFNDLPLATTDTASIHHKLHVTQLCGPRWPTCLACQAEQLRRYEAKKRSRPSCLHMTASIKAGADLLSHRWALPLVPEA